MGKAETYDRVPFEDVHESCGPDESGLLSHRFYAFDTVVTLQAFGDAEACAAAFGDARRACRAYERRFSRTLPRSDVAKLNAAAGKPVAVHPDTCALLREALRYCADSEGRFDVTIGAVSRLWDFSAATMPSRADLDSALPHVDWRRLRAWEEQADAGSGVRAWAQLDDPLASVDVGGIAKGWIADRLAELFAERGIASFAANLGGNVIVGDAKPGGAPWRVGLQDPREKGAVAGVMELCRASAVTSGVYERCFERNGTLYHHILDPQTGLPVQTDVAGVTVIARRSIDAEGYSTTLLGLGTERGIAFARAHPRIESACFIDFEGNAHMA